MVNGHYNLYVHALHNGHGNIVFENEHYKYRLYPLNPDKHYGHIYKGLLIKSFSGKSKIHGHTPHGILIIDDNRVSTETFHNICPVCEAIWLRIPDRIKVQSIQTLRMIRKFKV